MKRPMHFWLTRVTACALALSFVAACGDSTGPSLEDVDPEGTAAIVAGILGSLEDNEELQIYNVMSEAIGEAMGGGVPLALDMEPATLPQSLAKFSQRLTACSLEPTGVLAGPIIPTILDNTVFEWNPQLMPPGYEAAAEPLSPDPYPDYDNVRFILYALQYNPVLDEWTVLDDQPVGYVDFVDESDQTGNTLRVVVAPTEGSPVVDYAVTCTLMGGYILQGTGFITDGTTQVNLDLEVQVMQLGPISIDFHLDVPSENLEIDFVADADDPEALESGEGTFTAMFEVSRNNSIRFNIQAVDGVLDGAVRFCDASDNCAVAAVISGTFDQPVITDSGGNELNPAAIAALAELFMAAGEFVNHLFPMLAPAFEICFGS